MDLLDKLYQRLVDAVDAAGADEYRGGMTVADVYQRLIPYRTVRGQVGVIELAEYEHALLRLLSGERQYIEVGDPTVRLEIQRELASLNPILGIYRDYSGATLELARGRPNGGAAAVGEDDRPDDESAEQATPSNVVSDDGAGRGLPPEIPPLVADATRVHLRPPEEASPAFARPGPERRETPPPPRGASAGSANAPDTPDVAGATPAARPADQRPASGDPRQMSSPTIDQCADCGRTLPDVADLSFCPFCGAAQAPRPCGRCGGEMYRGWTFCPRCGAARGVTAQSI